MVRWTQKYWPAAAPPGTFAVQPAEPESDEAEPFEPMMQVVIDPIASDAFT